MTGNGNGILPAVLDYAKRGLCVIPVRPGTKCAAVKWTRYQTKRPTEKELKRWFSGGKRYPAVILGGASGGLVCRDFDVQEAYVRWTRRHGGLADSLPTVSTARGSHVYFLSEWSGFVDLGDGELRGDGGHYCLLPPATHPTGVAYEWLVSLPAGRIPRIDPFANGLALEAPARPVTEENGGIRKEDSSNGLVAFEEETLAEIYEAMAQTMPVSAGQRNRAVFEFARRLRGIPRLTGLPVDAFKGFVEQWHKAALPVIGTKPFVETWIDFLKGWPRVKWPANKEFLPMMLERAQANPQGEYDEPGVAVLAGICRELHRPRGEGFYLATRTAGRLLGVSAMTISRWLFLLEHDRLIRTVEKGGTRGNPRKASRFVYLGPPSDTQPEKNRENATIDS